LYCIVFIGFLHQRTPLHVATEGKHKHTVERLVGHKADTNLQDNNGVSATIQLVTVQCCGCEFGSCSLAPK